MWRYKRTADANGESHCLCGRPFQRTEYRPERRRSNRAASRGKAEPKAKAKLGPKAKAKAKAQAAQRGRPAPSGTCAALA